MRFGIRATARRATCSTPKSSRITSLDGCRREDQTRVGADVSLDDPPRLRRNLLAIGAQKAGACPFQAPTVNCITGVEFLDTFNRGWLFSTAKKIIVVGAAIRRSMWPRWLALGHIGQSHKHAPLRFSRRICYACPYRRRRPGARRRRSTLTTLFRSKDDRRRT